MIKTFLILMLLTTGAAVLQAASKSTIVDGSSATAKEHGRAVEKLKKIDAVAAAETGETREAITGLGYRLGKDLLDMDVDRELVRAARDKSLNWRTRAILLERINREEKKQITKEEELSLYSDALMDAKEHNEVRKLAAQALMEPSRTEPKARKALEKAAKDKAMPADVLGSVMVSVGSSGIDDVDTLTELMKRPPKTNNEIGINLNAVRALGESKDPRAVGMLFKILDESKPDSFFNVTALEQLSFMIRRGPEEMEKLRPMLAPRLMKLLGNRSYIGASRQMAARMLLRMNERKAIPEILKWVKPKEEGGGNSTDMGWAFEILAEFQAKEVIPELQRAIDNVPNDSRWEDYKKIAVRDGNKFPSEVSKYIRLQESLKKLKGEPYDKKYVSLPWKYD